MDILVLDITDTINSQKPKHLGYPVNSEADDFGIFLFPGARKGYFSSNRNGQDQIFYMEKTFIEKDVEQLFAAEQDSSRTLVKDVSDTVKQSFAIDDKAIDKQNILAMAEPESQYDENARMLFFGPDSRDTTGLYKRYMDSLSLEKQRISEMVEYFEGSIDTADINHPLFFLESKAAVAALFQMKFPDKLTESNTRFRLNNFEDFQREQNTSDLNQKPQRNDSTTVAKNHSQGRDTAVPQTLDIGRIYYDYDRWSIKEESRQELDKLIRLMKQNPDMIVDLSSHTDASGSEAYNMLLSKKRALAAAAYMLSRGVEPERLIANYCGEYEPMKRKPNSRVQENRRTEFRLMKDSSASSVTEAREKILNSSEYKHCRTLSVKEMIYARQLFEGEAAGNYNYYLICGSFVHKNLAEAMKNELIMKGFLKTEILSDNDKGYHRVAIQGFNDREEAIAEMRRVRREVPELSETWMLTKKK
jgi:outer membrane protein OmpA-like peptidoglycan-associated protein